MLFPLQFPDNESYVMQRDIATDSSLLFMPNGELQFFPNFLDVPTSNSFLDYLIKNDSPTKSWSEIDPSQIAWKNINWKHEAIKMFGKSVLQPRFTAWHGDEGKSYTYSNLKMQPETWNEGLLKIKSKIETVSSHSFNSVLLNLYRDGNDYMGWHSDDERELGQNPTIASLNLGEARRFLFRRKENNAEKVEILLNHGSLLLMKEETQHFWQHSLPKQAKTKGIRINLTFRTIL